MSDKKIKQIIYVYDTEIQFTTGVSAERALSAQNNALVMQAVHSGFRQPEPDFIKWNTVANDEKGWEAVTDAINGEI